jgi:hypothetical protein
MDSGLGTENNQNWCVLEETKNSNNGGRQKRRGKNKKKNNKGEREEERTKIHSSSLGKPSEVVEKPHNRRWLALTLIERRRRVSP